MSECFGLFDAGRLKIRWEFLAILVTNSHDNRESVCTVFHGVPNLVQELVGVSKHSV